jgi:hypothetical protein
VPELRLSRSPASPDSPSTRPIITGLASLTAFLTGLGIITEESRLPWAARGLLV